MKISYGVAGMLALGLLAAGTLVAPHAVIHPAQAACDPGTPIDGTSADGTRRMMQKSGYSNIQVEQKGCDNVWHVMADKDGQRGRFAVEPGGKIYPEGN
jgi:hypothetical protein